MSWRAVSMLSVLIVPLVAGCAGGPIEGEPSAALADSAPSPAPRGDISIGPIEVAGNWGSEGVPLEPFDRRSDVVGTDILEQIVGGRMRTTVGDIQGDARSERQNNQVAITELRGPAGGLERIDEPRGGDLLADITDLPDRSGTDYWPTPRETPVREVTSAPVGGDLLADVTDVTIDEPRSTRGAVEVTVTGHIPDRVEEMVGNLSPIEETVIVTPEPAPADRWVQARPVREPVEIMIDDEEEPFLEPMIATIDVVDDALLDDLGLDDEAISVVFDETPVDTAPSSGNMQPVDEQIPAPLGGEIIVEAARDEEPVEMMEPIGADVLTEFGGDGMVEVTFGDEVPAMEPVEMMEPIGADVLTEFGDGGMVEVTFGDEVPAMEPVEMMEPIGADVLTDFGGGGMVELSGGSPPDLTPIDVAPMNDDFMNDDFITEMTGSDGMTEMVSDTMMDDGGFDPTPAPMTSPWRDQRVAVINNAESPVAPSFVETVRDRMTIDGYPVSAPRGCDVLIVCRRTVRTVAPTYNEADTAYSLTTTLPFYDLESNLPVTPWVASVVITLDSWTDHGQEIDLLRDIEIRIGAQGLESPRFRQKDLDELRATLDGWARGMSGRQYR